MKTSFRAAASWRAGLGSLLLLAALGIGAAHCAPTKWRVRTVQSDIALQWPYQPNQAKLTYIQSVSGFAANSSGARRLAAMVFGTEEADRDSFILPVAVAAAPDGRMAVADMGRKCVHLYVPAHQRYLKLYGRKQEPLQSPVAVLFDDQMRLFVSDSVGKVFAFDPDGQPLFILRQAGGVALQRPTGLAFSPQTQLLYVVDTLANKVYAFGRQGDLALSFGDRGEGPGQFNFPTHIFRSPAGELYVTDSLNFRIATFTEDGKFLRAFGHHGDGSGDIAMPKGVAVDRDGSIYVVDGIFDNVQLFSRDGVFLLTVGKQGTDFGEFWLPSGTFISDKDELFVCDTYNRRVQVFRIVDGYAQAAS